MPNSIADSLTPEQRRHEVAAILGSGVHRVCAACRDAPRTRDPAPIFAGQKALDVSAPGDPHVSWLTEPRT
jgi:hypothetical protein